MSTVSSVNPGVADVLQTLSNLGSPLTSSQSLETALEKASPADVVQLSNAATQLQNVDVLFGVPAPTSTSNTDISNLLSTLLSNANGTSTTSTSTPAASTSTTAQQLLSSEAAQQTSEMDALLGVNPENPTNLYDLIG
jgi:hypothetical protein